MTDEQAAAAAGETPDEAPPWSLRGALRDLYFGADRRAARFQYGLIVFDVATIIFFLTVTVMAEAAWLLWVDLALAIVLSLDFAARIYIAQHPARQLRNWITIADAIVIVSLIIPVFTGDYSTFAFLRVLRAARLARSYHLFESLKRRHQWVRQHEDAIQSAIHMVLFLFVTTAIVYVHQVDRNPMIETYVDALYFTVATLTTTGFGDITLEGETGKLLAVAVMIVGIALFIRLAQTIFMPARVNYRCPECGLLKHEPDAVHCKHCGTVIDIPNEG
jgi:voltage-gated potassium channel